MNLNKLILIIIFSKISICVLGQQLINFPGKDGLVISADLYEISPQAPYVIMFHQAGSSRGEYREIAPKIVKLGYNCLAVDIRSGKEFNYVPNKTAALAQELKLPNHYIASLSDMQSAIEWASHRSRKPIIIMGSSFSASLALLLAKINPQVLAVIAFSPGEYFEKSNFVRDTIKNLKVPVFIGCTKDEYPFVKNLVSEIPPQFLTLFYPSKGKGIHGAKALFKENSTNEEYWLALLLFFNQIKD